MRRVIPYYIAAMDLKFHDKQRTEAMIAVLEYFHFTGKIDDTKGIELSGAYWDSIKNEIKERCAANSSRGDNIDPNNRNGRLEILFIWQVDSLIAEYKNKLKIIKDGEYDRELDNKSKHAAIKANRILKWAIGISALAATGLPQYL